MYISELCVKSSGKLKKKLTLPRGVQGGRECVLSSHHTMEEFGRVDSEAELCDCQACVCPMEGARGRQGGGMAGQR